MRNVRKLGFAALLAAAGPVAAQPAPNPFFPPPAPVVPVAAPPTGRLVKYFGHQPESRSVGPVLAQPLPNVIPASAGNPFFPTEPVRPAVMLMPSGPQNPYFGPLAPSAPPLIAAPLPSIIPDSMPNPFFNDSVKRIDGSSCEPGCLVPGFRPDGAPGDPGSCDTEFADPDHPANKHPLLYKLRFGRDPEDPRFWFSAEYLLWHPSGDRITAPLAASSNTQNLGLLLADPRNQAVADNRVLRFGMASGMRLSGGWWGEEHCCVSYGLEVSAFMLERKADGFTLGSDGAGQPPVLRPFIDSRTGLPSVAVVSFPNVAAGSLSVSSSTLLWGTELNAVRRIHYDGGWHLDMLAGLRYIDLDENLSVLQNSNLIGPGAAGFGGRTVRAPAGLLIQDDYDTRTHFYGVQFGARVGRRFHRLTVEAYGKTALGWSHSTGNASGSTSLLLPGGVPPAGIAGGFLNVPSNSGQRTGDDFAVVPETGFQIGYDITKWLRLTTGYTAMYWSRVARPGTQVNWTVNPTQVPSSLVYGQPGTDPVTAGPLARTGLWVNGVTFGAVFKY